MSRSVVLFLLVALIGLSFAPRVAAFGAGNIPSFSYLEDKAFRHGDIEDIIEKLFKAAAGGFLSRGRKFEPLDVKRVYFGNWLRDYSQAVDVGALKKTNLQTIINICMVLGFLAHGYATKEFEVTEERLGCYLPTEHIDNPKGYADGEDARKYDPRLRGPVDPVELQIDPQTGMKNYIANENGHWATSKALVRQRLEQCIHRGRQYRSTGSDADQYEAFRLLGTALHTLEDFTAHSNFCELALISMGNNQVFPHVGQNVKIRAPNGRDVYPLVTGTFGGADFIHSLMGEATDHLSQASVSELTTKMANARSISEGQSNSSDALRQIFLQIPGGGGESMTRDMDSVQNMRAGQPGGLDPSQMSPQELHAVLWKILSFRDSVMQKIENTINKIPGLSGLVEKVSNSVSVFIITTLEPFVKPLIGTATSALGQSSQAVIDSHDQEEVWNDWNASDPTHSFLSKDHFGLILNQPAGEIAQTIVEYSVNLVVKAWDNNNMSPNEVTEPILECLFHPDFSYGRSQIQRMMLDKMRAWIDSTGNKGEILNRLTSDAVRQHRNVRPGHTGGDTHVHNALLPEGGLQAVVASHNIHVPGAQVLNAGQDLMGGKMPWQQGFGSGGPNAWRGMDENGQSSNYDGAPSGTAAYQQEDHRPAPEQHFSGPPPSSGYEGSGNYGHQPYGQQQQQPPYQPPPQPQYGGGFQQDQYQGGGYPQQHDQYQGGGYGQPPEQYQGGGYGQQPDQYQGGGYGQQPDPYQQGSYGQQQGFGQGYGQGYQGGPPPPPPQQGWGGPGYGNPPPPPPPQNHGWRSNNQDFYQ